MRIWLAVAGGAVLGAVLIAVLVAALGSDGSARPARSPSPELTTGDCLELVPDSVFETLGWSGQAAAPDAGGCTKRGDDGYVSVGARPIVASGEERAAAAEKEYDKQCTGLYDGSDVLPERDPDWLPDGTTACARLLPKNAKGNAALYFLTEQHEVVEIRMGALTATPEEKLQATFAALVATADRRW